MRQFASFFPHFMYSIGLAREEHVSVSVELNTNYNPFFTFPQFKGRAIRDIAMLKHVNGESMTFYTKMVEESKTKDDSLVNELYLQVTAAIFFSQTEMGFSHNDLHSDNIMIGECSPNISFLYLFQNGEELLVNSMGKVSVIIDYGFAYSDACSDEKGINQVMCSPYFINVGIFPISRDFASDMRCFLVRLSNERCFIEPMCLERQPHRAQFLNKLQIIRNDPENCLEKSGWLVPGKDELGNITFARELKSVFKDLLGSEGYQECELFGKQQYFWSFMDQLCLMLRPSDFNEHESTQRTRADLQVTVQNFNREWLNLERNFVNERYRTTKEFVEDHTCFAFKVCIESMLRSGFRTDEKGNIEVIKPEHRANAFSEMFHARLTSIWEHFDTSLFSGAAIFYNLSILTEIFDDRLIEKERECREKNHRLNKKIFGNATTPFDFYKLLKSFFIADKPIAFNQESRVFVIDCIAKKYLVLSPFNAISGTTRESQTKELVSLYNNIKSK
jgi:serine/threonine protein kinase